MWMTEGGIITSVRQAKSPKKQIRVLAELNAVSPDEIKKIVGENEKKNPAKKKKPHPMRPWTKAEEAELRAMIEAKLRLKEIAARIGRSEGSINGKIDDLGIKRNIYKTKGK